jgi:hypothetical protein
MYYSLSNYSINIYKAAYISKQFILGIYYEAKLFITKQYIL